MAAIPIAIGLAILVVTGVVLVHFWAITVCVIGGAAVLFGLACMAAIIRENISYGWPWWTL
jgi:hypothetical protein